MIETAGRMGFWRSTGRLPFHTHFHSEPSAGRFTESTPFLDRRLYIPESWFDKAHAAKRKKCGVPGELVFKTEPELGLEMLTEINQRGVVPFAWVNADEHYGMNPDFLDGVAGLNKWYFAEVPVSTMVAESLHD